MTANTAVMLRLLRLPCTLEPTQTANSGAPVQRLTEQIAEAVTRPIFFSAIARPYVTYVAVALRRFPGRDGRQPRRGEGWEGGTDGRCVDTADLAARIGPR